MGNKLDYSGKAVSAKDILLFWSDNSILKGQQAIWACESIFCHHIQHVSNFW